MNRRNVTVGELSKSLEGYGAQTKIILEIRAGVARLVTDTVKPIEIIKFIKYEK